MTTSETDILEGTPSENVTLSNGLEVSINRLKTRETLKLLKILTRGAGYALSTIDLNGETDDFAESLIMALIFAIPEAEDEVIDFVNIMVTPAGLIADAKSKAEKEINSNLVQKFDDTLDNPELEDLMDIFTAIINAESPHIQALGKKMALLLKSYTPSKS